MRAASVYILGSGHLAHRVSKLLTASGHPVVHVKSLREQMTDGDASTLDAIKDALRDMQLEAARMIYVLFDTDADNLEVVISLLALFPDVPVSTSLFNENIRPHLEAANPSLRILNPARMSAPVFIAALEAPIARAGKGLRRIAFKPTLPARPKDAFLPTLVAAFIVLAISAAAYFHFYEGMAWIDAAYFMVVTISTVGYGDFNLQRAAPLSKIIGMAVMLASSVFIWVIFSLVIDRIIKRRVQLALGRRRYYYKDHIILCGLGRLGYFIAEALCAQGEQVVIIEQNEDSANAAYFRSRGVDVYHGNARLPRVLQDAGAAQCRALISVINDDYANLEIGLNARHFQPGLRLILRIFDASMAAVIREKFDIHLTQSMSAIAAEKFAALLDQ